MSDEPITMKAAELRLLQGAAAVFPVAVAVKLLPFKNKSAERWLYNMDLVKPMWIEDDGVTRKIEVVIWGRVLEAIEAGSVPAENREEQEDTSERLAL